MPVVSVRIIEEEMAALRIVADTLSKAKCMGRHDGLGEPIFSVDFSGRTAQKAIRVIERIIREGRRSEKRTTETTRDDN